MSDGPAPIQIERFISYAEMAEDAQRWAASKDFDGVAAVAGVPRSGAMVASIVALHRNIHVLTLEDIASGNIQQPVLRRGKVKMPGGPIMVIEDTVRSGNSILSVKRRLGSRTACGRTILYGSLYARSFSAAHVNSHGTLIPRWSTFAWNWKQDKLMQYTLIDMDGVLHPDVDRLAPDIRPLFIPTIPVRAIVTGRGEHLRDKTEAWLQKWRIPYEALYMAPTDASERQSIGGPAGFKAAIYANDKFARLFVESDLKQSKSIAEAAGRPVLCTKNWKLYQ